MAKQIAKPMATVKRRRRQYRMPRLTDEQSELAGRYYSYAHKLAHALMRDHLDNEFVRDRILESIPVVLMRAALTFRPEVNVRFTWHLRRRLLYHSSDIRSGKILTKSQRFNDDMNRSWDTAGMGLRSVPRDRYAWDIAGPEEALKALLPKQREVVRRYYIEDKTMVEIARELGKSEARVCAIHKEAIEYLRYRFRSQSDRPITQQRRKPGDDSPAGPTLSPTANSSPDLMT